MKIRLATLKDAPALLKIYAPYVLHTSVTFEYDVPDEAEFTSRIAGILEKYPYLVAEEDGQILGYKLGAWHDMVWMEKTLCPHTVPPKPFIPYPDLETPEF